MKTLNRFFIVMISPLAFAACSGSDVDIAPVATPQEEASDVDSNGQRIAMPAAEIERLNAQLKIAAGNTNSVFFSFDSSAINEEGQATLQKIAVFLKEKKVNSLAVEGHCDERGTREYNLALGDRRAVAVKKYLVGLGVPAQSLATVSYGKERPANPAHTEEAWAENRRGSVVIK